MKKAIPILLALCLLLSGCTATDGGETTPTQPPEPYTVHYADYTQRSMTATVVSYAEELGYMGRLNNLYENQAAILYEKLNAGEYRRSYLEVPTGVPYVQITFRPHSDEGAEVFTLYENDLVQAGHTSGRQRLHTAAAGTYYQVLTYLKAVRKEQNKLVTLQGFDGENQKAGYTIHYSGKEKFVAADLDTTTVDVVGESLVRVQTPDTCTFYQVEKQKETRLNALMTDLAGECVAAADRAGVTLYPLFSTKAVARVYVAAPAEDTDPIRGLSFTEDGEKLHLVSQNIAGTVQDFTLTVSSLTKDKQRYLLGEWQEAGGYVSEATAQSIGYKTLKKLRGKEKEWGHVFSSLPTASYVLDGVTYYLIEIGYWSEGQYTKVTDLMVNKNLSAGYQAILGENQLTWDTANDWFD